MVERKAYEALSSRPRLEILKLLHKEPLTVDDMAELLNLKPITIRHHLESLEDAGFIESYQERTGSVGRPKEHYQIAKEPTIVGYPKRRYLALSSFIINALQPLMGSEKANWLLKRVGKKMGESVVREIESNHDIKEWSSRVFTEFFIKGYLEQAGAEPETVKITANRVVYRIHNCLYLELAVKMPETMCDVVHLAFHEGVNSAMNGKVRINRLTCKGHGDAYCEHECEWRAFSRARA